MKQYIPCKPNPYGFKLWAFADSDTGYTVDFNVYFGSSGKTEAGLTTKVVLDLIDPGPELKIGPGYKLCLDNYYTSNDLFATLWDKKVMVCGTMRTNRKGYGIPNNYSAVQHKRPTASRASRRLDYRT